MGDSKFHSVVKQTSKEDKVVAVEEHLEEHHEENKTMNRQYFVQFESFVITRKQKLNLHKTKM